MIAIILVGFVAVGLAMVALFVLLSRAARRVAPSGNVRRVSPSTSSNDTPVNIAPVSPPTLVADDSAALNPGGGSFGGGGADAGWTDTAPDAPASGASDSGASESSSSSDSGGGGDSGGSSDGGS